VRKISLVTILASAASSIAMTSTAYAADCSTLPSPLYISASGNHKALLKQASAVLSQGATPVTIVFQSYVSCVALDQLVTNTNATSSPIYWDSTGAEVACTIPVAGVPPDVAMSDVYASTCGTTLPSTMKDFVGPIQVMAFVTSAGSSETSISAQAAYVTLGFGGTTYPVAPWTDVNFLFIRPDTAGTKLLIANAIGLPVGKWKGQSRPTAGDVLTSISTTTNPAATLGIITTELSDAYRTAVAGKQLKTLAFQHKGQSCGYYPDSSSTSFDKRNVREGRYPLWGPFHVATRVDGQGKPSDPEAEKFVNVITRNGLTEAQKQSMTDAEIAAHAVPACAMKVERTSEMSVPTKRAADEPCGCYFETKTGGAATSCTACTDDSGCAAGANKKCRFGFCEAR
jgi:hypothetical protein